MRLFHRCQIAAGLLLLSVPAFAGPRTSSSKMHRHPSVKHVSGSSRSSRVVRHESGTVMPTERATAIQSALIRRGYLSGEPTGAWDAQTVSAMQRMQADNGWQSKLTPDSRALIKLGLGGPEQASETAHESPQ